MFTGGVKQCTLLKTNAIPPAPYSKEYASSRRGYARRSALFNSKEIKKVSAGRMPVERG